METAEKINSIINSIVWGPFMLIFLAAVGVIMSVRIGFFQLRGIRTWWMETFGSMFSKKKRETKKGEISSFGAMSAALAGAIGTGNIVGVATAITLGGAGAVFWMWIAAFFGMATIYAENYLGVLYREKHENGYVGGPMYYISKGLHSKFMATAFAIFCILASIGMGSMTQANSVACAMEVSFNIPPAAVGLFLSVFVLIIIFGGISRITKLTEKLLPFMAVSFILGALIVIAFNIQNLPSAISSVFSSAFGLDSVSGGFLGYGMSRAVKYGISRGVFSNEAGLGSSPIVHAAADTAIPERQGMWGIFQVFIDTIVMCTLTALCILCTGGAESNLDGAALGAYAFESVFGDFGSYFVCISIALFGFATLVTWSYFGEKSLEYLTHGKFIGVYRVIYALSAFLGCILELKFVWAVADTLNGLMAIPNLIALLLLSAKVKPPQTPSQSTSGRRFLRRE